ncbi:EamA-like transporter family protein [bacterium BMS3Bbin10]|nr:EamA-like transporter family protein [bacterium BMS3Bbin10]
MDLIIAGMVLLSAAIHPIWNLFLKREPDTQLAYLGMTVVLAAAGLVHALIAGSDIWSAGAVIPLLALSWCGQILYGTCLTATLTRGDLSSYYPIIRASPVFIVIVGVVLLGASYSWYVLLGMAMTVAGGFLLLYRRGTHFLEDPRTLGLALLAMSGTGIYSIADSGLMKTLDPQVMIFWIETSLIPVYLTLYLHRRTHTLFVDPRPMGRRVAMLILPGVMAYGAYYLILMAYQMGGEVAAVTSLRQASIPISVMLGGFFLREGAILRRLIAASLLTAGIVVIVMMG